MSLTDLTDEQLASKIAELGAEIASHAKDPRTGAFSPPVVLAVRALTQALEEYHGKPLAHGDHDAAARVLAESQPTGRYRLLRDEPRFDLKAGDMLVCGRMHPAWAREKVAVLYRERDHFMPSCSQYRDNVEFVSGTQV